MKKRMRQLLEAEARVRRGRALRNNTGIKGTWDGGVKRKRGRKVDRKQEIKNKHKSTQGGEVESEMRG